MLDDEKVDKTPVVVAARSRCDILRPGTNTISAGSQA